MTFTAAIIINVGLDLALLGLLAFVTSRTTKLTSHLSRTLVPVAPAAQPAHQHARRRHAPHPSRLDPVAD